MAVTTRPRPPAAEHDSGGSQPTYEKFASGWKRRGERGGLEKERRGEGQIPCPAQQQESLGSLKKLWKLRRVCLGSIRRRGAVSSLCSSLCLSLSASFLLSAFPSLRLSILVDWLVVEESISTSMAFGVDEGIWAFWGRLCSRDSYGACSSS